MGEDTILEQMQHGIQLARSGDRAGAETVFEGVLGQRPNHEEALIWKAAVVDDPDESIRCLEEALRVNPANKRARVGLEWAYKRKKGQDEPALSGGPAVVPKGANPARPAPNPSANAQATFQPGTQVGKVVRPAGQPYPVEAVTKVAPYKKRRLKGNEAENPPVELPPEAVRWSQPPRPKANRSPATSRSFDFYDESAVFKAAQAPVGFSVTSKVARAYEARSAQLISVRWPLGLFGLAIGLALLSFPLSNLATGLGIIALFATFLGVVLLNRARL